MKERGREEEGKMKERGRIDRKEEGNIIERGRKDKG